MKNNANFYTVEIINLLLTCADKDNFDYAAIRHILDVDKLYQRVLTNNRTEDIWLRIGYIQGVCSMLDPIARFGRTSDELS